MVDCGASDQRAHPWPVDTAGPHHFIVMVIEAKLAEASRFVPLPEVAHSEVRSAAIPLRGNLILNRAPFFLVGPQGTNSSAAASIAHRIGSIVFSKASGAAQQPVSRCRRSLY